MNNEGLVFFRGNIDGSSVEVAEYTEDELADARRILKAVERFKVQGRSDWHTQAFFNEHAKNLEKKARIFRMAADAIQQRIEERGGRK